MDPYDQHLKKESKKKKKKKNNNKTERKPTEQERTTKVKVLDVAGVKAKRENLI